MRFVGPSRCSSGRQWLGNGVLTISFNFLWTHTTKELSTLLTVIVSDCVIEISSRSKIMPLFLMRKSLIVTTSACSNLLLRILKQNHHLCLPSKFHILEHAFIPHMNILCCIFVQYFKIQGIDVFCIPSIEK